MKVNKDSRRNFLKSAATGVTALTASGCKTSNYFSKNSTNKNTITVHSKIRENLQTDVLVVGGGPAGIGAAIGAKKAGADTLLIENYGF